jgi:PTS system cellobiose-specific IIA component
MEETIFKIIAYSGEAKSCLMDAISLAKLKKFDEAENKIKESKKNKILANDSHLDLFQKEALGETITLSLLLSHAEDQMMSVETIEILAKEIIDIYKKL